MTSANLVLTEPALMVVLKFPHKEGSFLVCGTPSAGIVRICCTDTGTPSAAATSESGVPGGGVISR
jgi:hypothetical protein